MLWNIAQTGSSLFAQTNFTVDIITESWFAEAAGSAAITALPAVFCTVLKLVRRSVIFIIGGSPLEIQRIILIAFGI